MKFIALHFGVILHLLVYASGDDLPDHINNGKVIGPDEYRWFTGVKRLGKLICGGSWIGSKYVITASHCTLGVEDSLFAHVGYYCGESVAEDNLFCDRPNDVVAVVAVDYLPSGGDFALLTLRDAPALPSNTPYAALDPKGKILRRLNKKSRMVVVGAGKTAVGTSNPGAETQSSSFARSDFVEKLELKYISPKKCAKKGITRELQGYICSVPVTNKKGTGPCQGDSGGPVVVWVDDNRPVVVAVHSFGRIGCDAVRNKPDGHYAVTKEARKLINNMVCKDKENTPSWCRRKGKDTQSIDEEPVPTSPTFSPTLAPVISLSSIVVVTLEGSPTLPNAKQKTVAFSPRHEDQVLTGGFALSGSPGVKLYLNLFTPQDVEIYPFLGHEAFNMVHSVRYSRDGKFIASASEDRTLRVWDAETLDGSPALRVLEGHNSQAFAVDWNHDGTLLVSSAGGGPFGSTQVWVWAVNKGQTLHLLDVDPVAQVPGVCWLQAFEFTAQLVTASYDGTVRVWNGETGEEVAVLTLDEPGVGMTAVACHPRLPIIATGSIDGSVTFWDYDGVDATFRRLTAGFFNGHEGQVNALDFSNDGAYLVSGSHDGTMKIWDVSGGPALYTLENANSDGSLSPVDGVAWRPHQSSFPMVAGTFENQVRIWELRRLGIIAIPGNGE